VTFGVVAAVAASSSSTSDVTPGVLGFLVVAGIGVALVFLLRSMNKQFHKITPEGPEGPGGPERADGPGGPGDLEGAARRDPPG
jgi:hypothetical protein